MAVSGLEKITNRILEDAQKQAEEILNEARAEASAITAEYESKVEELKKQLIASAGKQRAEMISRAESTANMERRNLLLQAQSQEIDKVFRNVYDKTVALDRDAYLKLMTGLLASVFRQQIQTEQENIALYGVEETVIPESYELRMNRKDAETIGRQLVTEVKEKLKGKIPSERLDVLTLSGEHPNIDGGFILHYGDIETNCVLSDLFAELRVQCLSEVGHALFDKK